MVMASFLSVLVFLSESFAKLEINSGLMTIARIPWDVRKEKRLTQEGLARKADISYHTIIKLESPVLRWLAGLVILAVMIAIGIVIFYGIGCIAAKIPFFLNWPTGSFWGTVAGGVFLLCVVFIATYIVAAICVGVNALGEKFFDP